MKLSIIIPTHKRAEMLSECVYSILDNNAKYDYEILVISDCNDKATDTLMDYVIRNHPNVWYFSQKISGPSASRNLGMKEAKGQLIVFLDDDCIVSENWINTIINSHKKNTKADAISGKLEIANLNIVREYLYAFEPSNYFKWRRNQNIVLSLVNNVSYKRRVINKLKKFNPHLKTAEDVEWNYRMHKEGMTALYDNRIVAYHFYRTTLSGLMIQAFGFGHGRAYIFKKLDDYPEDRSNMVLYAVRFIVIPFISPWIRLFYGFTHKKNWWPLYLLLGYLQQIAYWSGFIAGLLRSF